MKRLSYNDLVLAARTALLEELNRLELIEYGTALKIIDESIDGVYLIYAPDGELLYVGQHKVRSRLQNHISRNGVILTHELAKRGLDTPPKKGHRCGCGQVIECREGEILEKPLAAETVAQIKREILSSYKIAVLDGTRDGIGRMHRTMEFFVQEALRPKYGSWPAWKEGWTKIPRHSDPGIPGLTFSAGGAIDAEPHARHNAPRKGGTP